MTHSINARSGRDGPKLLSFQSGMRWLEIIKSGLDSGCSVQGWS